MLFYAENTGCYFFGLYKAVLGIYTKMTTAKNKMWVKQEN